MENHTHPLGGLVTEDTDYFVVDDNDQYHFADSFPCSKCGKDIIDFQGPSIGACWQVREFLILRGKVLTELPDLNCATEFWFDEETGKPYCCITTPELEDILTNTLGRLIEEEENE